VDIRKIYEYALQREREGRKFFLDNAERVSHAVAADAFRQLAAEEQAHIEYIEAQLAALACGEQEGAAASTGLESADLFATRAEAEMLDQTVLEAMVPDLPVLRMAYLIERDFAEFYEMAASRAEGQASEVLTTLAQWERGHEKLFKRMHDMAFEEYARMPWGG
jgi:rubrerythrin